MDDLYWSFEETGPAYTGDLDGGLVPADASATSTSVRLRCSGFLALIFAE